MNAGMIMVCGWIQADDCMTMQTLMAHWWHDVRDVRRHDECDNDSVYHNVACVYQFVECTKAGQGMHLLYHCSLIIECRRQAEN